MFRIALVSVLAVLLLSGCGELGQQSSTTPAQEKSARGQSAPGAVQDMAVTAQRREGAPKLAYSHQVALEMAAATIAPRFERARTACLEEAALGCSLISASINVGDVNTGVPPEATMTVRLPHDQIAAFEKVLFAPLPGEGKGEPLLRFRSTDAEDLTYAIADIDRRLAQATDYRDRLTALSKRGEAKVQDLIEIEQKLSEVQSNIEAMSAEQRGLNIRVETELLTVTLNAHASLAVVSSPLAEAWRDAARVLGASAAAAFTFLVVALPWLPLVALAAYLLSRLWRLVRKRRALATQATPGAGATAPTTP